MRKSINEGYGKEWVAVILAVGLATAVNLIVIGGFASAVYRKAELSENATQVMTAVFGGIVGVLGSYVGYKAGQATERHQQGEFERGRAAGTEEEVTRQQSASPPPLAVEDDDEP